LRDFAMLHGFARTRREILKTAAGAGALALSGAPLIARYAVGQIGVRLEAL
jgi:hypothetical protein